MNTTTLNLTTAATTIAATGSQNFFDKLNTPTAGWVAIVVCSICFGTNLVPVKKFNMGDGMAFQWLMCSGVLLVGVIVQILVSVLYRVPQFHPLAMLGGALWATGNSLTVIIIECVGLSIGILIWSIANMLFGFTTGRFGIFGIPGKVPSKPAMNYAGVAIAVASVALYAAIKPANTEEADITPENGENEADNDRNDSSKGGLCNCSRISQLPSGLRRTIGVILAIVAGSFYGNTFVPTIYIQSMVKGASQEGLDYVFANFVGIWLTSTAIFVIYSIFQRNRPMFPTSAAILPSLASGILWGLAQSSWFIANAALGEPITFPVVTTCPTVIATLLGLFVFREIKGKRNFILLVVAFTVTFTGVILNALSK